MPGSEFTNREVYIILEILEYVPYSIVIKTIIRKSNGSVCAVSFDTGQSLTDRISKYETFIQIVEGEAEVGIEEKRFHLKAGHAIIIPAGAKNNITANVRFKMISTILKGADVVKPVKPSRLPVSSTNIGKMPIE